MYVILFYVKHILAAGSSLPALFTEHISFPSQPFILSLDLCVSHQSLSPNSPTVVIGYQCANGVVSDYKRAHGAPIIALENGFGYALSHFV